MLFTPISVSELHQTDNLMNKEENITLGFSLRYIIYYKIAFKFSFCLQYTMKPLFADTPLSRTPL